MGKKKTEYEIIFSRKLVATMLSSTYTLMILRKKCSKRKLLVFVLMTMLLFLFAYIDEILYHERFQSLNTTHLLKPAHSQPGFLPVGDIFTSYAYSAHYDNRSRDDIIQITVLLKAMTSTHYFICILWDSDNKPIKIKGRLEFIPDWRSPQYYSGFVKCSLNGIKDRFTEISLIPTSMKNRYTNITYPQNILYIKYPDTHYKRNFTRCVPALFDYSNRVNLIQMIEHDRLMGTEYFVIYDYKNNHNVKDILEFYRKKGLLEINPWNLPITSNSESDVHYHAQYLSIHDCLMKNLHVSRYVLFADIDELVVSRKFNTWNKIVDDHTTMRCGAYSFQSAFFQSNVTKYPFPLKKLAVEYNLNIFLWTIHTDFFPHGERSKVLLDPQTVWICKVHAIRYFVSFFTPVCYIEPENAFLHHYRTSEFPSIYKHENIDMLSERTEQHIKNIVLVIGETKKDGNKIP